ncbi:MAG: nitrile hydratase subunit beta [Propylenella sp.]
MNGPHDLGGAQGFGPIAPEPDEPAFHAKWERRVFALTLAMGGTGAWTLDMSRQARERIPPADYLASSYYEIWLRGLERLTVEKGLATAAEVASGKASEPPVSLPQKVTADNVAAALAKGAPTEREPSSPARFKVGDMVRARVMNPSSHTRLPRYLRGRKGRIAAVRGVHVFADASAAGRGEDPRWLYSVTFDSPEVWGPEGRNGDEIAIDLWDPYLERA